MTTRLSTGLVNKLLDTAPFKNIFAGGVIDIYSGAQPSSADDAASGTKLVTLTLSSGALTQETAATGSITLTGGASGSVDAVTVNSVDILGGAVSFDTSLTLTATAVALQINRNPKNTQYVASSSGAVVTITAVNGLGTLVNSLTVSATLTTITASYVNTSGGVANVNGLKFDMAAAGVISKLSSQTWSGTAVATGTAGWFRLRTAADAGTGSSTTAARLDGAVSTSGAQMNLGSLTITLAAPFVLSTAAFTLPQA